MLWTSLLSAPRTTVKLRMHYAGAAVEVLMDQTQALVVQAFRLTHLIPTKRKVCMLGMAHGK